MALTKSTQTTIMNAQSVTADSSATSSSYDVTGAIAAGFDVFLDYSSDPTSGNITLNVYSSQDNTNWSNIPSYVVDVTPSTDTRIVFSCDVIGDKYLTVEVVNNTDQDVTATIKAINTSI